MNEATDTPGLSRLVIPGRGDCSECSFPLGREPPQQPKPTKPRPTRKAWGRLGQPHAEVPEIRGSLPGRQKPVPGPSSLGDAGPGPDASSSPFRRQPSNRAQPHPPPGYQARARSREAGPRNQWAPRAEWKGLSDPHDVTKLARSAPLFRSHAPGRGPLFSSPPTRHCAANRKAGRAPARTCGRGRVAALRGRVAEWAGLGQGAELQGVARDCVEGPPGGAAAAAASLLRRSGSSPAVPGSYSLLRAPSRPVRNHPPPAQSCEGAAGARGERRPRACEGTSPGAPGAREGVGAAAGVAALGAAAGSVVVGGPAAPAVSAGGAVRTRSRVGSREVRRRWRGVSA